MFCKRLYYQSSRNWPEIHNWLQQRLLPEQDMERQVLTIINEVKRGGDQALVQFTKKFDAPEFTAKQLQVNPQDITQAIAQIPKHDLEIIKQAAVNIRNFHQKQQEHSWIMNKEGITLGQLVRPVQRAGLYIPGGQSGETPLISTLLMTAIPAQVAGVEEIIVTSPPRKDGTVSPYTLAAAELLGISKIFATGSAWAVAALALGTESIPKVDIIAGPGNIYVTTAKRLLNGITGIDIIAGPSEIVILADEQAKAPWLAADLLSQAEHDPFASSILISTSAQLLEATEQELQKQLANLKRAAIAKESLAHWGALIQVDNIDQGLGLVNKLAPEHFELCIQDPWSKLWLIKNAGAVFLGNYTPEAIGDYFAGPNHVLPTTGAARYSSALGVQNFCKKTSLIAGSADFIKTHGEKVIRLAELERLEAHAQSVKIRLQ